MAGWTPLFSKITQSSIWDESDHVRLAWIAILATTEKDGICPVKTAKGLAALARLTVAKSEEAMKVLSSPDQNSPNQDFDGRRIELLPNDGIRVLNWEKYRSKAQSEATRESKRIAQERYRHKRMNDENSATEPPVDQTDDVSWTGRKLR